MSYFVEYRVSNYKNSLEFEAFYRLRGGLLEEV